MSKIAMITGASGLIGHSFLKMVLKDATFEKVIVLVRKQLDMTHPKLEQIIVDFDKLEEVHQSAQYFFCFLGTTIKIAKTQEAFKKVDYDYVLAFARLAQKNNAEQFHVVTAMGASTKSKIFYSRVKGMVEEDIQKLNLKNIYIYKPSMLIGPREQVRGEKRLGEEIGLAIMKLVKPIWLGPLFQYKPIHVDQVARAVLNHAKQFDSKKITYVDSAEMNK